LIERNEEAAVSHRPTGDHAAQPPAPLAGGSGVASFALVTIAIRLVPILKTAESVRWYRPSSTFHLPGGTDPVRAFVICWSTPMTSDDKPSDKSFDDKGLQLFVTTRDSRAKEVAADAVDAELKAMLEVEWARVNGLDIDKVRASATGTDSTCSQQLASSPTFSSTQTKPPQGVGIDVTTDQTTDAGKTITVTDDIKNDDPGTGGVIDIPI